MTNHSDSGHTPQLSLEDFFPFRLARLQLAVSNTIAELYTGRFNLSRHEWRVLATLGGAKPLTAKAVCGLTNLDKMQTSRAIAKMEAAELILRTADDKDKRSALLELTDEGQALYQQIVPLVLAKEQKLLSVLSKNEQQQLMQLMDKLLHQATQE